MRQATVRLAITIAVLAILALLVWAVFRGLASRELILKKNGLPLANLKADVLSTPALGVVKTSTDIDGRLDLSNIPAGTEMIAITLWEGTAIAFNGDIFLPTGGSRTIDFRGDQSITTTTRTHADFVLFKLTGRETQCTTNREPRKN